MTLSLDFDAAAALVGRARDAAQLFGTERVSAQARFRRLARVLHPDAVAPDQRASATGLFARLASLYQQHLDGPRHGALGRHALGPLAHTGDVANLYRSGDRLVKVPREPTDNDLMEREAAALRRLDGRGEPRFAPYVPRLVDSLRHTDPATGARRVVNVLSVTGQGGLRALTEVRAAYPDGVDPRDAAWMWRRLLVALGFAHRAGVIHGAVLPEHVLIEPTEHGLVLVDWCYSTVDGGDRIPALVTARRDWYPAEVTGKQPPGPGTDIAMATRCVTWLMGGPGDRVPRALRAFADGCTQTSLRHRPDDAWRLLGELDAVLRQLYGPRTFRPFTV